MDKDTRLLRVAIPTLTQGSISSPPLMAPAIPAHTHHRSSSSSSRHHLPPRTSRVSWGKWITLLSSGSCRLCKGRLSLKEGCPLHLAATVSILRPRRPPTRRWTSRPFWVASGELPLRSSTLTTKLITVQRTALSHPPLSMGVLARLRQGPTQQLRCRTSWHSLRGTGSELEEGTKGIHLRICGQ